MEEDVSAAAALPVAEPARPPLGEVPATAQRPNLDRLAERWQVALDAAEAAIAAEAGFLPSAEVGTRARAIAAERQTVAASLARVAASIRAAPPWLSPIRVTPKLLGLPPGTEACLFDLDDVLTNSGVLHAWAWSEVFDDFLLRTA